MSRGSGTKGSCWSVEARYMSLKYSQERSTIQEFDNLQDYDDYKPYRIQPYGFDSEARVKRMLEQIQQFSDALAKRRGSK